MDDEIKLIAPGCGHPTKEEGYRLCEMCRSYTRQYARRNQLNLKRYHQSKKNGLCSRCGHQEPAAGKTRCKSCLEYGRQWIKQYRDSMAVEIECLFCSNIFSKVQVRHRLPVCDSCFRELPFPNRKILQGEMAPGVYRDSYYWVCICGEIEAGFLVREKAAKAYKEHRKCCKTKTIHLNTVKKRLTPEP